MTGSPFDIEPDQVTLARARRGDLPACEAIYRLFHQPAYSIAYRICQCPQLAQDVCQEAFITAFGRLRQFRGESPFWGWLRRVVVNHAISTLRRQPRHQAIALEEAHLAEAGVESKLDLTLDLADALANLDAEDRAVVWLHDVEGYNHKEIATLFGMSESFSKTRLSRARARLREWLSPAPGSGSPPGKLEDDPRRPSTAEPEAVPSLQQSAGIAQAQTIQSCETTQWMNVDCCPAAHTS